MGLLTKVSVGAKPAKKASDDVLLVLGMLLMTAADGILEQSEISTVEAFFNTLPEFDSTDFNELLGEANKVIARYGTLKESVKGLAEVESEAMRRKLFALAADIAMSSGDVDESEDQMLESFQRLLKVPDELAMKIVEVLSIKYAT